MKKLMYSIPRTGADLIYRRQILKRIYFFLLALAASLTLFSSCGFPFANTPPSASAASPAAYVFDEEEFMTRYQAALDKVNAGVVPVSEAPRDPEETGFAVLPLSTEHYGASAFAVLPIKERALTDDEMLWLAYSMEELPAERLFENCWAPPDGGRLSMNPLTHLDQNRLSSLRCKYLYENLRPSEPWSNDSAKAQLLVVSAPASRETFLIYPSQPLSDEQLLQIAGRQLENYIPPGENQLQFEDVDETVLRFLKDYMISDELPEAVYHMFVASAEDSRLNIPSCWQIQLHFSAGSDYSMVISADGGMVTSFTRYPENYFSTEILYSEEASITAQHEKTEAEIISRAAEYATHVQGIVNDEHSLEVTAVSSKQGFTAVTLEPSSGVSENCFAYRLKINNYDLSIEAFSVGIFTITESTASYGWYW